METRDFFRWLHFLGQAGFAMALLLAVSACNSSSSDSKPAGPEMPKLAEEVIRPIVFVHGTAGSASQYQTQAQRFASNGYPADRIVGFEYSTATQAEALAAAAGSQNERLDAFIDEQLEKFDADQVYLVCHSLGTAVCPRYLVSDSSRAAKVAKYIAVDGQTGDSCTADVPCMGVFGSKPDAKLGDHNLNIANESHVQVATSEASFAGQFEFLTGVAPVRTTILPEAGPVAVSGRAVYFPANTGADGTTLNIWAIDSATGHRIDEEPLASFEIDESGNWGPAMLDPQAHYELHLVRPGRSDHHFYRQPVLRGSNLVRLNTSPAGSAIEENTNSGPSHATLVISRDMEWWTSHESGENDVLEIGTISPLWGDQPAVNILRPEMGNGDIGIHVHDTAERPAVTTGDLIAYFVGQPFQSGVDVYMPATSPPDGTISVVSSPRGDASRKQVLNVPNWASSKHRISLIFNDYIQD